MADDLFPQLHAFEWRSSGKGVLPVQFPTTHMRVSLHHDIAAHGVWGQDGEHQEATGRKSLVFSASIPFRNGVTPGKSEKFGTLYPDAYRAFLVATADRSTGTLMHPELGATLCRVQSVESNWDPTKRDGCDVECTWIETLPPDTDFEAQDSTAVAVATIGALTLDAELSATQVRDGVAGQIRNDLGQKAFKFVTKPYATPTTDLMSFVASIGDQTALLEQRFAGKIDKIQGALTRIEDSANRPGKVATQIIRKNTLRAKDLADDARRARDFVRDPNLTAAAEACLAWPIRQQIAILRSALNDVKKTLLETGKTVVFYTVPADCTLASITNSTGALLKDLMALNPGLVRRAVVPSGTVVRYYA